MSFLTRIWDDVKTWASASRSAETILVELEAWEHDLLQKFHPLFRQIEATLSTQGVQIVEGALTSVMGTISSGGDIGAGIAAAASTAEVSALSNLSADAKNATYGVLAAVAATLPIPTQETPAEAAPEA